MATEDSYGQGVDIAALTDAPNAEALVKGITDTLVPRSNMRFASASERNATITAPVGGMRAFLTDTGFDTVYDGTAWVVVSSGTSAWTTITPASPWTQDGNDNGTWQYRILMVSGERSIQIRGGLGRASWPTSPPGNFVLTNSALPVAVRPTSRRTFLIPCSDTASDRLAMKVDYKVDGHLEVFGFGPTARPPWLSFNGVLVSL